MITKEIPYNDLATLRSLIVGSQIKSVFKENAGWTNETEANGRVVIELSNGVRLEALEAEGCGGCSQGWWSVGSDASVGATIMNLDLVETYTATGGPVTARDSAWTLEQDSMVQIRLFALTDGGPVNLLNSFGQDNGYYGWGFHLKVLLPTRHRELVGW